MPSIFVYQLANMARHRNILKNAKRQLKAQKAHKEKQQEKKTNCVKSQKSIATTAPPEIVKPPQEINELETPLNFALTLSSTTDPQTLFEHCLLLKQANDFISNRIKQTALEKYQLQQRIFQINAHLQKNAEP